MVLQWIPREKLIPTLNQIDQSGARYIFIKDFLPSKPRTSVSSHNSEVRIFKQDYAKIFTAIPYYKIIYHKLEEEKYGENYVRCVTLIKRVPLEEAYADTKPANEKDIRKSRSALMRKQAVK